MEGMCVQGKKGCVHRIRKCVVELLLMAEEDQELAADDEEGWEVMGSDLCLKATFLYCDLNQLIAAAGAREEPRKLQALADVANKLFAYVEQLEQAVKRRSMASTQDCYKETVHVLQQLMAALMPMH
ncbi:photosynthetic NDH subunit of lumenal location 3, chloroplastic-like [Zingiber officinale]|uniref:photosynthetic NDH subunit of lumenal location 3, chloroplastic-like n=1 Tax=Zingiber officinale TaxID=94328 RepID=UPI001C4B7AFB|nr:photosynthetic NDH subunit of lumenal location 3, chloroplastic-like [Zingiber officinale]